MRLIQVLETVNQIEKTPFLRLLDQFSTELRGSDPRVDAILADPDASLKNVDNANLVALFRVVEPLYKAHLDEAIRYSDQKLDIVVDILIRDGNALMSRDWFSRLYARHFKTLEKSIGAFGTIAEKGHKDLEAGRSRDYSIYRDCVRTAYENDLLANRDARLSWEERSVLETLAGALDLSQEEVRSLTYSIVPFKKDSVDNLIGSLREAGLAFFNRRTSTLFLPDEILWLLREILGVDIANKYVRRILRHLTDPELNLVGRRHNVAPKLSRDAKIQAVLDHNVDVRRMLTEGIFRDSVAKSDRSARIQALIGNLGLGMERSGRSLEDKVDNVISHFSALEREGGSNLSRDGFHRLLSHLRESFPGLPEQIRSEFQLEPEDVMRPGVLGAYGVKPRDVLYLIPAAVLRPFCLAQGIKSRGNLVANILDSYRNIDDLFIEHFDLVGRRDLAGLRDQGLDVKESELGLLFERVTKKVLKRLGLDVDESLRRKINTKKAQMDVVLNLGNRELLIVECKTAKDRHFDKYSSVSRQLQSYQQLCERKGYRVAQVILVASDFSEEFISECEYDQHLNLSLMTAEGLARILEAFRESRNSEFPVRLLMKAGLLNANRIAKVLGA